MARLKHAAGPRDNEITSGSPSPVSLCDAFPVTLVWVTGNSGAGKSTVCEYLKSSGQLAFDADWEGYSHWVDRAGGNIVADPPYPVPAGWLDRFAWKIDRAQVEAAAARTRGETAFLCGSAENEAEGRERCSNLFACQPTAPTARCRSPRLGPAIQDRCPHCKARIGPYVPAAGLE
jgi:hypothetical protein